MGAPVLRPYDAADLRDLYRVCLLTGDSGADASHLYTDPDLIGHIWAAPYPVADPSLTFVVDDDDGVAGYVVGTADTVAFDAWLEEHWWPPLRARYPLPPDEDTPDARLVARLHHPPPSDPPVGYPAHLHIDLLPRVQGRGFGRRLIDTLCAALAERGVPGVHLGVGARNQRARAFYPHLGFGEVRPGVMVRPTAAAMRAGATGAAEGRR